MIIYHRFYFVPFVAFLFVMMSCSTDVNTIDDIAIIELEDFEVVSAYEDEDNVFSTPTILKYDGYSRLFVYDDSQYKIFEISTSGELLNEYGRGGSGPGEFLQVNNIFLVENYVYAVESLQFFIHKFEVGGGYLSSMDYGELLGGPTSPPAPMASSIILPKTIVNQPSITLDENILLSFIMMSESDTTESVYQLRDWEGNFIASIGEVPLGSSFHHDIDQMRSDVQNRVVPAMYRPYAFPVMDNLNTDEIYIVYNVIPRISKYRNNGDKLWESEVPYVAEIDSIRSRFYNVMDRFIREDPSLRISLNYYTSGVSSPDGNLFLATDSNPVFLHEFNSTGVLVNRYEIISDDVEVRPIFDIDFENRRIFLITEEADIRAYSF